MNGKRVFWDEGMFLKPQHFQCQDRFHFTELSTWSHQMFPYGWGIKSLIVREDLLLRGVIEIESCELWFQDGAHVTYPGNALIDTACVNGLHINRGEKISIYLVLHEENERETVIDCGERTGGDDVRTVKPRFSVARSDISDMADSSKQTPVSYLQYRLYLVDEAGRENLGPHYAIKALVLFRDETGLRLDSKHVPPVLAVCYNRNLSHLLIGVVHAVEQWGHQLMRKAQLPRSAGYCGQCHGLSVFVPYLMSQLPLLRQCAIQPGSSPARAHSLLQKINFYLSSLRYAGGGQCAGGDSDETAHADHAHYDHENLFPLFSNLCRHIALVLDDLSVEEGVVLELRREQGLFVMEWPAEQEPDRHEYFLCLSDANRMQPCLPETIRIGSRQRIRYLISNCIAGVSVYAISDGDHRFPHVQADSCYRLLTSGYEWECVERDRTLAVDIGATSASTRVTLVLMPNDHINI